MGHEEFMKMKFEEMKSDNIVTKPSHYERWPEEPINFIMKNDMEFWRGNIIKYISRAGFKQYDNMSMIESEITDLEKVRRYAEMRINQLEGKSPNAKKDPCTCSS